MLSTGGSSLTPFFTTADSTTAIFGLCTCKRGTFALEGDPHSPKNAKFVTTFFLNPRAGNLCTYSLVASHPHSLTGVLLSAVLASIDPPPAIPSLFLLGQHCLQMFPCQYLRSRSKCSFLKKKKS